MASLPAAAFLASAPDRSSRMMHAAGRAVFRTSGGMPRRRDAAAPRSALAALDGSHVARRRLAGVLAELALPGQRV
jgi:hypothetical protein